MAAPPRPSRSRSPSPSPNPSLSSGSRPRPHLRLRLGDRLFWSCLALLTGVTVSIGEVIMAFTPRQVRVRRYFHLVSLWARSALALHPVRLEGAANVPADGPVLFVSNHQSNMDIFLLHATIGHPFRWFCRHDLFAVPFLGRALRRLGAIPVDRGAGRRAAQALRAAVLLLEQGESVLIFPEGTWGDREGRMRSFKDGAVTLLRHARVPVVPLTIVGSNEANPPPSFRIERRAMRLVVHPPVPYETWGDAPATEVLDRLRAVIGAPLPHGATPAEGDDRNEPA